MVSIPEGFKVVTPAIPDGFKVVDQPKPEQPGLARTVLGDTSPEGFARQGGLTVRHATEGITALPAMAANLVALGMNKALEAAGVDYQFPDQAKLISDTLTEAGLPNPETATERVVGDASRALSAGGSIVKGGQVLGNIAGTAGRNGGGG